MTSINLKVNKHGFCLKCASVTKDPLFWVNKKCLPVWRNNGVVMFHLPSELKDLGHAEKMLIQRVSPFVSLHHMKNGILGMTGHVCAFEQDVNEFITRLPRCKDDISLLRVIKKVRTEIGSDEIKDKAFRVRKSKVLGALNWLKEHNPLFSDIIIDASALDWIDGEEGDIEGLIVSTEEIDASNDVLDKATEDVGPVPGFYDPNNVKGDNVAAFGYIATGGKAELSPNDSVINNALQEAVDGSSRMKEITVDWPAIKDQPVSEYSDTRIFALAFPWLFPGKLCMLYIRSCLIDNLLIKLISGGEGDVIDSEWKIAEWGKRLLYYEDGRFAADKIFTFFALNYIVRKRNSSSGMFFVDNFNSECPDTLEELQDKIRSGDTTFINSLTYWNKRVKGSTAYWYQKRSELYTWINHHVERGNGAPLFFITLSCAEHYWPDIIALLKERLEIAGEDTSMCYVGSPKLAQYLNDYTIVVQEYFQQRVVLWLETVGKKVFGIEHYWVRYEFAPGRGQIHAHLLAIPKNPTLHQLSYELQKNRDNGECRADIIGEWAAKQFGLTASVEDGFDEIEVGSDNTPVKVRLSAVPKTELNSDKQSLMKHVQCHECSKFCLRDKKNSKW
jgi:hypothetical protein